MSLLTRMKGQEKAVALTLGGAASLAIAGLLTWFNLTSQPAETVEQTEATPRESAASGKPAARPETALVLPTETDPASPAGDKRTSPEKPLPGSADPASTASSEPAPAPEPEAAPEAAPEAGAADATQTASVPKFDLVRVDPQGGAMVAGKADPGGQVAVYLDGTVIAEATADASGSFVAMFDMPANGAAQVITLGSRDRDGTEATSDEQVVVVGPEPAGADQPEPSGAAAIAETPDKAGSEVAVANADKPLENSTETAVRPKAKPEAPAIIIASSEGARLMQPGGAQDQPPSVMSEVTLDLIAYDDSGEVVLSGRGKADRHVRVYVDDRPVKTLPVAEDGSWQLSLPEVDAGRYRLRVDQIDDRGKVTSRLETPFQKEKPEDVKLAAAVEKPLQAIEKVTIQRGATLWALAKGKYGEGRLYMQIFNANRSQIRDPDLIYPGQIFTLPD